MLTKKMTPFEEIFTSMKIKLKDKYSNLHMIPKLSKVVVSMCINEATRNNKIVDSLKPYLEMIIGQRTCYTYAKTSNSNFHLREGMKLGLKGTLRGFNMYTFLEKTIYYTLSKNNNFKGLTEKNLDGNGNLNIGIDDLRYFLELPRNKFDNEFGFKNKYGLNISIHTTATNNNDALILLNEYNFPFINKKTRGNL
ncbi:MAG: 50S ribosomal protein L5 [Pseudomonadota bacterium]